MGRGVRPGIGGVRIGGRGQNILGAKLALPDLKKKLDQ